MSQPHSVQNRTPEFKQIVAEASRRLRAAPNSSRASLLSASEKRAATPIQQRSEFASQAAEVGRGITATYSKLERLTALAQKRSIFDDRPVEINELTFVIKQDISQLTKKLKELQALTPAAAGKNGQNQISEHSSNVVRLLNGKLATMGTAFKDTLETRTKNVQAARSRFTASVQAAASPLSGTPRTDSPLLQLPQSQSGSSSAMDMDILDLNPSSSSALTRHAPQSHQAQLLMMEEGSNTYIEQRGAQISLIEQTMAELGGMFTQLAEIVSIQGEQIQRIDADVMDTVENVDGAQRELLKYWSRVSGVSITQTLTVCTC